MTHAQIAAESISRSTIVPGRNPETQATPGGRRDPPRK